jgi:hypothetical protein
MAITSLNNVNQLIFAVVKCGVLSEVRTGFLNGIWTSLGFKGLTTGHNLNKEGCLGTN